MLRCMIVEIHAVTLFNSRNSNILHAAVASTKHFTRSCRLYFLATGKFVARGRSIAPNW